MVIYAKGEDVWFPNSSKLKCKELREALGYSGSDNAGVDSALHTILFSISKQGIIDATPTYLNLNPNSPPSPVFQLDFVAQTPKEFKTISTEKAMLLAGKGHTTKNITGIWK